MTKQTTLSIILRDSGYWSRLWCTQWLDLENRLLPWKSSSLALDHTAAASFFFFTREVLFYVQGTCVTVCPFKEEELIIIQQIIEADTCIYIPNHENYHFTLLFFSFHKWCRGASNGETQCEQY